MRLLLVEDERDTAEALAWGLAGRGLCRRRGGQQRRRRAVEGDRERLRRHRPGRDAAWPDGPIRPKPIAVPPSVTLLWQELL